MPVIPEYSASPGLGLATNDRAENSRNIAARTIGRQTSEAAGEISSLGHRIGSTIAQVGNAVEDYNAHKEISAGGLMTSQVLLAKQNEWNERVKNSDPNDPSVQGKFLDSLEETFGQLRDSFSTRRGQEWADSRINQMRQHFTQTTTADMSTLAGIAAHNNFVQSANTLTALVDKDPHALSTAVDMLRDNVSSVADSSPTLKGTAAEKFKTEATQKGMEALVKTAVQASIRRGGDGTEISDDPKYAPYINSQERNQFVMMQRQEQRAANADARMARLEDKQAKQDASEANLDKVIKSVYDPDPAKEKVTAKEIIALPDDQMTPAHREHALKLIESRADAEPVNPNVAKTTAMQMIKDINDGKITSKDQIYSQLGTKLDQPRFDRVMAEFTGRKSADQDTLNDRRSRFMSQYGPIVNPQDMLGQHTDSGHIRQYNLYDLGLKQEAKLRSQGKDPQTAYDPQSPDFIGRMPEAQPPNPALILQETKDKQAQAAKQLTPQDQTVLRQYPDAKRGADQQWRVVRNGQVMIVKP